MATRAGPRASCPARAADARGKVLSGWLRRGRRPLPEQASELARPERVERILVIKAHDQLGDFLLATPALRALRERYPHALLALVTRTYLAPLAWRNRGIDQVWVLPRMGDPGAVLAWTRTVAAVAAFRPDLAFVMNSVSRSRSADALATVSGARLVVGRSAVRAGPLPEVADDPFAAALESMGSRDPVYDLDLPFGRGSEHQIDRYLDLVRWTGASSADRRMRLDLAENERRDGAWVLRDLPRPRIGLHPGAANPLKCWPLESFVELGASLVRALQPPRLVMFDSPREAERGLTLQAGLESRGVWVQRVPAQWSIGVFAVMCSALDLLVCNDSGVLHIAAALDVPTVSFHSLGRPEEWAPQSSRAVALYAPRAIESIPVSDALAAARRLLERADAATTDPEWSGSMARPRPSSASP